MEMKGGEMCHAAQGPQIECLIEVSVDVFEYAVHPRRIFSLVGFPAQSRIHTPITDDLKDRFTTTNPMFISPGRLSQKEFWAR